MKFDILKSSVNVSRWGKSSGSLSLIFEVVPTERDYIEIGEEYILCSRRSLIIRGKERKPVNATVTVSSDPATIEHIEGDKPVCGFASFYPEHTSHSDFIPANLSCWVVVEPAAFAEMLRVNSVAPGAATLSLGIEGLEYSRVPDGLIWKLGNTSDKLDRRREISSFGYTADTFWTSEGAIHEQESRKTDAWLLDSPDPEERKLVDKVQDPVAELLKHCRMLLWWIFCVGVLALIGLFR
jgi:hypothetical protein